MTRDPNYYTARGQRFREHPAGREWDAHMNGLDDDWALQVEATAWNLFCYMLDDCAAGGRERMDGTGYPAYATYFHWLGKVGCLPYMAGFCPIDDTRYRDKFEPEARALGEKLDIALWETCEGLMAGKPASTYNPSIGWVAREIIEG